MVTGGQKYWNAPPPPPQMDAVGTISCTRSRILVQTGYLLVHTSMMTCGRKVRRLLWRTLPWVERRDAGGTTVARHLQFGGERSGLSLVIPYGLRSCQGQQQRQQSVTASDTDAQGAQQRTTEDIGRAEGVGRNFLCRRRDGSLHWPGMAPDRV